jgi:hypothetical protein
MMRRKVDTTRTARACQAASLILVLAMVLGALAEDIMRTAGRTDSARAETCPAGWPSCSHSASKQP